MILLAIVVVLSKKMCLKVAGRSIDRTVAKHNLEAGDVAMSIPDDLVVTLDRVFQDESLGKVLVVLCFDTFCCMYKAD